MRHALHRPLCRTLRHGLVVACLLFLLFCLLTACQREGPVTSTTAPETGTDAPTEAITAPATETPAESESEALTESPTEAATTEAVTAEPEPETLPEGKPDTPMVVTFCDTPRNEEFILPNSAATFEVVYDEEEGSILKLSVADSKRIGDPYVKINYAAYMEAAGLTPATWNECGVAVVLLKVESASSGMLEMTAYNKSGDKTKSLKTSGTYKTTDKGWQYVLLPLVEEPCDGTLTELRLDFIDNPKAPGETVYIKSITFMKDKITAMEMMNTILIHPGTATVEIPGLTEEYTFLHISDTHVSAFSDVDKASWSASRLQYNTARRAAFAADGLLAEERFPLLFDYANEICADGMFLTGDLIDFPSEKNLALLYDQVGRFKGSTIYCLGNHDWNYSDDYMTGNAVANNRPLFNDLTNGDPYFSYVEYEGFIVAAIDNSSDVVTDETVDKFLSLYEKNKPIILLLHVPFHVDTLEPDVKKVWNRNITMGPGGLGSDWSSVMRLYNAVCVAEDTPVVAVFAGHVHFNHEDVFPNGVPQYITSTGYTGDCRVVTVKGQ